MNNIKYKSIEIVGTDLGSDGRSCGLHPVCCGEDVLVDTKLKLFKATLKRKIKTKSIEVEEIEEIPTVKAFIWSSSATATCFIGFVSNVFQVLYGDALDGRVVDVYW
jgi:hypothetical protein